MKRRNVLVGIALGFMVITGSKAQAADVTAAVDINSSYVWRGLTFNDGPVIQPSIEVGMGGFALNVWGNVDIGDYGDTLDTGEFSEVDLTLSYSRSFGPVEVSGGVIEYLFPAGGPSTTEVFISTGVDIGAGFSAGLELYYDFDQVDDIYGVASVGYAVDFNDKLGLEIGASISYAGEDFAAAYANGTDGGLFNYTLSSSMSYAVTKELGVNISLSYSDSLDDNVLPDETVDKKFYGGVGVSYNF